MIVAALHAGAALVRHWLFRDRTLVRMLPGMSGKIDMPEKPSPPASIQALTEVEVQARLKAEGYNELPRADRRTPLRIVGEVLRDPMIALLLGGRAIYLLLGDLKEALILLAFATLSVVVRARWSSATASANASPAVRWYAAT
jgi:magnesium-transporting ATPase (P-type)